MPLTGQPEVSLTCLIQSEMFQSRWLFGVCVSVIRGTLKNLFSLAVRRPFTIKSNHFLGSELTQPLMMSAENQTHLSVVSQILIVTHNPCPNPSMPLLLNTKRPHHWLLSDPTTSPPFSFFKFIIILFASNATKTAGQNMNSVASFLWWKARWRWRRWEF